jgi:hypothetical protein
MLELPPVSSTPGDEFHRGYARTVLLRMMMTPRNGEIAEPRNPTVRARSSRNRQNVTGMY